MNWECKSLQVYKINFSASLDWHCHAVHESGRRIFYANKNLLTINNQIIYLHVHCTLGEHRAV